MFVNQSSVTPLADKCFNGTGITVEYNSIVEYLVPAVIYNITAVDPSASVSATPSAKLSATRLVVYCTGIFKIFMILTYSVWYTILI